MATTYEQWRETMIKINEIFGTDGYPMIIGDVMYPSAWHRYKGVGYDLHKLYDDIYKGGGVV